MNKRSSKKRIIIAASLFAIFLIGAIVSVVMVLAAEMQNVQTNISIAYIVDGVGAEVQSSYAIVPISESETIDRVAISSAEGETLSFGVSEDQSTAEMSPSSTDDIYLDSMHQQIVFEYYFKNTSAAAFSIELIDSPIIDLEGKDLTYNMSETYFVSKERLDVSDYRDRITDISLKPQALTELGQSVFIYISAKVTDENISANYGGSFIWDLSRQDTITVNLNDGDLDGDGADDERTLKIIPNSAVADINMPCIAIPTKDGSAFVGYYLDGTQYIDLTGTGVHVADLSANRTLTASWAAGMTIDGTTLISATADENGVLTIPDGVRVVGDGTTAVNTDATTVIIPNSVVEIADYAFDSNSALTTVTIGSETQTAAYADSYSDGGSRLKAIGHAAFSYCSSLTSITIPEGVTSIGSSAFSDCSSLTSITIPEGVTSIGDDTFYYCSSLTSITIPEGVTSIGSSAFYYCSSLSSITIPRSLTSIGESAFCGCSSMSRINLESLESWLSLSFVDEYGYSCYKHPFEYSDASTREYYLNGEPLTEAVIPSGVTRIPAYMFSCCAGLTSVSIPSSVTSIGSSAFYYCSSLSSITIPRSLTSIGESAFCGCSSMSRINLESLESWLSLSFVDEYGSGCYKHPFEYSGASTHEYYLNGEPLTDVVIPSGVTQIPAYAFYYGENITSVSIPSSVTSIGKWAFSNCSSLTYNTYDNAEYLGNEENPYMALIEASSTSITSCEISENTKIIACEAFFYCSLSSITIPSSVTSIGNDAFSSCSSLTSIDIPSSVTSIGSAAFSGCYNLVQIRNLSGLDLSDYGYEKPEFAEYITNAEDSFAGIFENGEKYLIFTNGAYKALLYVTNKTITDANDLPTDLTHINQYAFFYCSSLTSITIPSSVTSIGNYAFRGCSKLATVTFEENSQLTSIGEWAFSHCSSLSNITIPSSVTSIGEQAFYYCGKLATVTFEENSQLTSIGEWAFFSCSSLTSITIPSSVTSIGDYVFYSCSKLTSVTFENINGWFVSTSETATSGTNVTLSTTDLAANATLLKSTHVSKYWKRSA